MCDTAENTTLNFTYIQLKPSGYTFSVLFFLESVLVICLNTFLLAVIGRNKPLHTQDNLFLVNLFVSDLNTGICSIGYIVFLNTKTTDICFIHHTCLVVCIFGSFFTVISAEALLIVTAEKYMKICHPFIHMRVFSKKLTTVRILLSIYMLALVSSLIAIPFFVWDIKYPCNVILAFKMNVAVGGQLVMLIFLAIMTFLNVKIYLTARRQQRQIQVEASSIRNDANGRGSEKKGNVQQAKILALLILFVYVTYVPGSLLTIPAQRLMVDGQTFDADAILQVVYILTLLSSLANPVTFLCSHTQIKRAAKRMVSWQ
jgi:hypothetical protein